jgi:hypothetical protein
MRRRIFLLKCRKAGAPVLLTLLKHLRKRLSYKNDWRLRPAIFDVLAGKHKA